MKKIVVFAGLLCSFFCAVPTAGNAGAPVVYELFTSQNCPSCPPADQVLSDLAAQGDVIALACHITYFDSAQRRDPFSRDFCTKRQSAYNKAMGRGHRVFTPQAIINGQVQVNAADRNAVAAAIAAAAMQDVAPIALSLTPDNTLDIVMPQLAAPGGPYHVRVISYRKNNISAKRPGTNQPLPPYAHAVHALDDGGPPWQGESRIVHFHLDASRLTGAWAVIAEDPQTGRIIAAGRLES